MQTIFLSDCRYNKDKRMLEIPYSVLREYPVQFLVRSQTTCKEVRFSVIGPEDSMYDEDQWDGEQKIYRPIGNVPTVEYAVVSHFYDY